MERHLLGESFVSRRGRREVLEDERIANGIAQDLEQDLGRELLEADFGIRANRLVGIVSEVEVEAREDRARQRERPARGGLADRKRRPARKDPLEDRIESRRGRRSGSATQTRPPAITAALGPADERSDLKREARGP